MKLLYIVHQFFPKYYTGTERYTLNLANMMKLMGHDVSIMTYDPHLKEKEKNVKREGDFLVQRYQYNNIPVISIRTRKDDGYISFSLDNKPIELKIRELFKAISPDIIHITHPMRLAPSFFISKKMGIKTVVTLTDYWVMCGKGILLRNNDSPCMSPENGKNCKKYCYKQLQEKVLKKRVDLGREIFSKADALIASANFLKRLYEINDYDISKLKIIRHGFNYFQHYKPIKKKKNKFFVFASLGSLIPNKGADLLINSFRRIADKNIRLDIYGEPHDMQYYKYLHKIKREDKRINFKNKYTFDDIPKIHEEVDVIVQPSKWYETYPLVGVAALAYGVPIIVPDLSGSKELVSNKENGYIFSFGDRDSLADCMMMAIKDNLKLNKNIFYPYTIEEEATYTENLYHTLIRK